MFLPGALYATSDMNLVNVAVHGGHRLLYIGDSFEMPKEINFVDAVAFTPNYKTMCAIIENNTQMMQQFYYENLSAGPAQELFAIILAVLRKGVNITMFFPPDSLQLQYPTLLLQYIEQVLGIQTGTDKILPAYNENYNVKNMRLMYIFKLISWKEMLLVCEEVDPLLMQRFKEDLCPIYGLDQNISDLDMMNEIEKIKKHLQNELQKPARLFSRVEENK